MYNLEVDADHCYRVGEQGILVHNQSYIEQGCDPCATKAKNQIVYANGEGGQYRADVDAFMGAGANLKVCRVHSISGALVYSTGGRAAEGETAQKEMRKLIFGVDPNKRTMLQKQYLPQPGVYTYAAGHCIADVLGGPGNTVNLVPMNATFNGQGGAWGKTEAYIRNCLRDKEADSGTMTVNLDYDINAQDIQKYIPTSITISVTLKTDTRLEACPRMPFITRTHTFKNVPADPVPSWVVNKEMCVKRS